MLFEPGKIGALTLPNRLIRSATAERMAEPDGRPRPPMKDLYKELAQGGVGLIISGHMYVAPSGKAHPEMTAIHDDALIPDLAELTAAVHGAGGRIAAQINHGGMQCRRRTVSGTMSGTLSQSVAPSAIDAPFLSQPAREMTTGEIDAAVEAYADVAGRAQQAGFDAVQIHGAHGYLISQFLSPFTNRRTDKWGGDLEGRMRFLEAVCEAVRRRVGPDYPVFIKLGMMDAVEGGLTPEDGAEVAAALARMGLDGVEISGGISGGEDLNTRSGVSSRADEAYFRPLARRARARTSLPIALVGGLRSRAVMEDVLEAGDADFISMSRPLICEPHLPNRLREGIRDRSSCTSANRCWPDGPGEGIGCRCPVERGG
jgi:2,4-dienoyl-CoA reductase-like NADH-dependent reductase (Old Yellow Enzyme family)